MIKYVTIDKEESELAVRSLPALDIPDVFNPQDAETDRVYIVNICIRDSRLEMEYHKMLQEQCNLNDLIMHRHLEWVYEMLKNSGFIFNRFVGKVPLAGIFIEIVDDEHYNFVAPINLELLEEQEGVEIAGYFVDYFKMRRDEKMRVERLQRS